jgi:hypothetical protein
LPAKTLDGNKKTSKIVSRFLWIVKDKEAFEELLNQLKYYNDSLYNLYPSDIRNTVSRDALSAMIQSANVEMLRDPRYVCFFAAVRLST